MLAFAYANKNEQDFVTIAERLGYKALCFMYDEISPAPVLQTKLKIFSAVLNPKNIQKTRQQIDLLFASKNFRHALEQEDIDIIVHQELEMPKDSIYQKQSGLNQVLCTIATKKEKIVGIDFCMLLHKNKIERAKIMGRIQQNIELCKKYKTLLAVFCIAQTPSELRAPKDVLAFFSLYGLNKKNMTILYERIAYNKKRREGKIIGKGVEVIDSIL